MTEAERIDTLERQMRGLYAQNTARKTDIDLLRGRLQKSEEQQNVLWAQIHSLKQQNERLMNIMGRIAKNQEELGGAERLWQPIYA